jgi:hypothetical protein
MGTQVNPSWARWCFASVSEHFTKNVQTLPLFIEGQQRDTRGEKDFLELRMDGPQFTELSKGYWRIYGEVNILVSSVMDVTNYHRIHQSVGIVAAAFTDIVIFKYGNYPGDDNTVFGCWKLIQDKAKRQRVDIFHFGRVDVKSQIVQATVEGHYEMHKEVS